MAGSRVIVVGADAEPRSVLAVLKKYPSRLVHIIGTPPERQEGRALATILANEGHRSRLWVAHLDAVEEVFATASKIILEEQEVVVYSNGVHQTSLLSAAFVHGIPALEVRNSRVRELPVLPYDYGSQLAGAKLAILEVVRDNPAQLSEVIRYTKLKPSALSYHLHGTSKKPGLLSMRVVSQDEKKRLSITSKGHAIVRGLEGSKKR